MPPTDFQVFFAALPAHKGGLTLEHNPHAVYYQTVADYILEEESRHCPPSWATPECKAKAEQSNELWYLQWYPSTPVGSYALWSSDLTTLLQRAQAISPNE